MSKVDLHTHTVLSDGMDTLSALISKAKSASLSVLGVTDHDIINSLPSMQDDEGLLVVCGIEITSVELNTAGQPRELHLLGLGVRETEELKRYVRKMWDLRYIRLLEMSRRLAIHTRCECTVTEKELRGQVDGKMPMRIDLARVLYAKYNMDSIYPDAYSLMKALLSREGVAYVSIAAYGSVGAIQSESAVKMILDAGGIPAIAHPERHASHFHIPTLTERLRAVAGNRLMFEYKSEVPMVNGCPPTFGSDYHGREGKNQLGVELTDAAYDKLMSILCSIRH